MITFYYANYDHGTISLIEGRNDGPNRVVVRGEGDKGDGKPDFKATDDYEYFESWHLAHRAISAKAGHRLQNAQGELYAALEFADSVLNLQPVQ